MSLQAKHNVWEYGQLPVHALCPTLDLPTLILVHQKLLSKSATGANGESECRDFQGPEDLTGSDDGCAGEPSQVDALPGTDHTAECHSQCNWVCLRERVCGGVGWPGISQTPLKPPRSQACLQACIITFSLITFKPSLWRAGNVSTHPQGPPPPHPPPPVPRNFPQPAPFPKP